MKKRLYKSKKDKKVSGVIGGISEVYGMDSGLMRLLFTTALLFTGCIPLIILYFVSEWFLPFEEELEKEEEQMVVPTKHK